MMRSWLSTSRRAAPIAAVILAMVSIQCGATLAKQLFPLVGAQGATTLRVSLAALIMAIATRPWRGWARPASVWPLLVYGVALGGMNLTFYMALRTIPLGLAVALEFTGPLVVAVLASRRPTDFLWIGLAVLGLGLLLPHGLGSAALDPVGIGFALAAGLGWGLYIVFGQRAGAQFGRRTAALGTIIAALVVIPFGAAHAGLALLSPSILPLALVVALTTSALPYSLEMYGMTRLPQRSFGLLMSLEPALGALSGLVFLHERLTWLQIGAVAAIIAASAGSVATLRRPANEIA